MTTQPHPNLSAECYDLRNIPSSEQVEDNDIPKVYYSVSDTAKQIGITPAILPHYVNALGVKPELTKAGYMRAFTKKQVATLVLFGKLIQIGFSYKGAAKQMKRAEEILKVALP